METEERIDGEGASVGEEQEKAIEVWSQYIMYIHEVKNVYVFIFLKEGKDH